VLKDTDGHQGNKELKKIMDGINNVVVEIFKHLEDKARVLAKAL